MKTTKIYIEVPVADRLPEKEGDTLFFVDKENIHYIGWYYKSDGFYAFNGQKKVDPLYWLEPIDVPTDEEIENHSLLQEEFCNCFDKGVEWILQKLKINQK